MDRIPIEQASQLDALDNDEVTEGYLDGFGNSPAPGNNRSYSYWHGWRNGMVDAGYAVPDSSQRQLAKDAIETGYLKRAQL